MNKKVLTLCAGFLLAGSLTATAQVCETNGEFPYRSREVKSAKLDKNLQDVKEINQEYYYQLQVDPGSLKGAASTDEYVLTAERDYSTGKIYLTAQKSNQATMTHSLWKITWKGLDVRNRVYVFENKETGYELSFDHMNALQMKDGKIAFTGDKNVNKDWKYGKDGLMDGCTFNWAWYTTEKHAEHSLGYEKVYSYFHVNKIDSVMALVAVGQDATKGSLGDLVYNTNEEGRKVVEGLSVKGLDGTNADDKGFAIVAVKESSKNAEDLIDNLKINALAIRPVVAGAKVLNAAEINTMIDANNSFLNFTNKEFTKPTFHAAGIAGYRFWKDAVKDAKTGMSTKFTVCKPGTNEPMTISSNPFEHEFTAVEANETKLRRTESGEYAGYNVLLETKDPILTAGNDKQYGYLCVTEHIYENGVFNYNHGGQIVNVSPYSLLVKDGTEGTDKGKRTVILKYITGTKGTKDDIDDALQARYHWKVTYYATNDSVVFEPLNASRMNQDDATQGRRFEQSKLAKATSAIYYNTINEGTDKGVNANLKEGTKFKGVPVALFAMNNGKTNADIANYLTVGAAQGKDVNGASVVAQNPNYAALKKGEVHNPAYVTNKDKYVYQSQMNLVVRFANNYENPYERATVADGLYFIQIKNVVKDPSLTETRKEGSYIVMDLGGHVVYDVWEKDRQEFTHMPATQWVVEQDWCLNKTGDLNNLNINRYPTVKVINREFREVGFAGQLYKSVKTGNLVTLNHRDYRWTSWGDVENHARYNFNCADELQFNKIEKPTTLGYFNETEETLRNTVYKFQQMYNMSLGSFLGVASTVDEYGNKVVKLSNEGVEFELYRSEGWYPKEQMVEYINPAGLKAVKGNGLWDFYYADSALYGYTNEKIGADQLHKTFYKVKVKDENLIDNDHTFLAIDDQHNYVIATDEQIKNDKGLHYAIVVLKENNHLGEDHGYVIENVLSYTVVKENATIDDLKGLYFDGKNAYYKDKELKNKMIELNTNRPWLKGNLLISEISTNAKINNKCTTAPSVFALKPVVRNLYRDLKASGLVNNPKKVIDLVTVDHQGNESLYEDSSSKLAQANKLNYLAAENLGNQTKREGFYVDAVAKSSAYMPQYLLVVAADSVPAYKYCEDGIHGINPGCGHEVEAPGYVEGRFLVNFNDSITNAIDKLTKRADAFRAHNRVRLGFVEGIHRGDNLYILKDTTLASIKKADKTGKLYVDPMFFNKANEGKKYDVVKLDGKHNNAAFSFREVGDADGNFLIESNDINGKAQIGSFGGAWIQILNNIPVLAQYYNVDGNHNTGDSTDSWKKYKDYVTFETEGAAINQSAIFTMKAVDKDAHATANETIATSDVTVSATNGAVVVKGAAGKAVVVTNILGQTLANAVISSDNASISVPAGIVVVAVEGEEAVKVVVK